MTKEKRYIYIYSRSDIVNLVLHNNNHIYSIINFILCITFQIKLILMSNNYLITITELFNYLDIYKVYIVIQKCIIFFKIS